MKHALMCVWNGVFLLFLGALAYTVKQEVMLSVTGTFAYFLIIAAILGYLLHIGTFVPLMLLIDGVTLGFLSFALRLIVNVRLSTFEDSVFSILLSVGWGLLIVLCVFAVWVWLLRSRRSYVATEAEIVSCERGFWRGRLACFMYEYLYKFKDSAGVEHEGSRSLLLLGKPIAAGTRLSLFYYYSYPARHFIVAKKG